MTAITAHSRQKRSRRKSVALFRLNTPHTARNAGEPPANRRKSAAFIEKLHICMETVIEKFVLCMVQSYWEDISIF